MINALEPHDVQAIERALTCALGQRTMDMKALMAIIQRFENCDRVCFRDCWVKINTIEEYDSIYKAPPDFAALLDWFAAFNAGLVAPEFIFYTFWHIHPLHDGNKRIGMALTYAYCQRHGLTRPDFPADQVHAIKVTLFAIHYGDQSVDALRELIF